MQNYLIFHPKYPGHIWAEVTENGETDNTILGHIISRMRDGIYTEKAFKLRCVPNIRNNKKPALNWLVAKKKDCTTLGKLFAPKKTRGSQDGLRAISEKDRFRGMDWESKREQIGAWISEGMSLGKIAKSLGVSPSALSKANKRYGLYTPKQRVA